MGHNLESSRLRLGAAALTLVLLCAISCSQIPADRPPPRLRHAQPSMEALGRQVLRALRDEDKQALMDLALSKDEFEKFIWPELPVSNPKTNVPIDFVWNELYRRSVSHLARILQDLGGRKVSLVRVRHRGEITEYRTHTAYPDMEVLLRDEQSGEEKEYPLFGTLVEMDGVFKIYSYAPYD